MTRRRAVNRLYGELSMPEAYGAFLIATGRADWKTAREVVSATPHHDVVFQRSDLMEWHEGFMALVDEFDRELQISLADSEAARIVHESSRVTVEMTASLAAEMYLSGVAAESGDADSLAHQEKAKEIAEAVLDKSQYTLKRLSERETAARQSAADLVLGFDSACRAAGFDPDVVARGHSTHEPEVLDDLRYVSPSPNANEWRLHFAEILLDHVSDAALD